MRIHVLNSCSGVNFSFGAGETVDAEPETAAELIRAGHAEPDEDQVEEATVGAPERAVARPVPRRKGGRR